MRLNSLKTPYLVLPHRDPEKRREYARQHYLANKQYYAEKHNRWRKENPDKARQLVYKYRAIHGRKDQPRLSDEERLHNYKPLQRWLEKPKLSPSVTELIEKAEQLFTKEEERRRLKIIYNREKARRYKAKLKSVLIVQIFKKDVRRQFALFNDCCAYCGKSESDEILHIDHFIPVSKGGAHVLGNLVPACKTCNLSKRNHHPEKWYKQQDFFDDKKWKLILKILNKSTKNIDQLNFL